MCVPLITFICFEHFDTASDHASFPVSRPPVALGRGDAEEVKEEVGFNIAHTCLYYLDCSSRSRLAKGYQIVITHLVNDATLCISGFGSPPSSMRGVAAPDDLRFGMRPLVPIYRNRALRRVEPPGSSNRCRFNMSIK